MSTGPDAARARLGTAARLVLIVAALAVVAVTAHRLIEGGNWLGVLIVGAVGMAVLVVYATRRLVPMKYLLPGLILLLGLQVWPVAYTAATAFTNYGYGHLLTKAEATEAIVANSVQEVPGAPRYAMSVAVKAGSDPITGEPHLLLTDPRDGRVFDGTGNGLLGLNPAGIQKSPTGKVLSAPGFTLLTAKEVNSRRDVQNLVVHTPQGGIKPIGLSHAFEGKASMTHDPATDVITDGSTGKRYVARDGSFIPEDGRGEGLPQGWRVSVGFDNFAAIITDPVIRTGFLSVFAWNIGYALLGVASAFFLGMLLALLFNDPRLKGKAVYRSLMILPYALPGFVTALVWASMFNQDYGLINQVTQVSIDWFGDPWAARAALLIANLWLGFPYMFIVCTGALQSIPGEVYEAARVDGVSRLQMLAKVTLPLVLVSVGPLLVASFAFTFNNFGLIFLMTGGGPFAAGNTSIGATDLLITYAYRLAFSGASPDYGLASAVSILIFLLVALLSLAGFRRSAKLEEFN
ncbi:ABC transporter permease subunit [Nonomuraea sp. NPDC050404]|uniref:ABC transporter permease subunit n=1 Tax=Nonomuraea sp. NPDC050404 TaxID=3155783 RepID=UPI0033FB37AF